MSWMQRLYQTYEEGGHLNLAEDEQLMPISHTLQNAHINIVIDQDGHFKRAKVLKKTQIILPATESSAGRSSGEAAHSLADKLQYVAQDYAAYGGQKHAYFAGYQEQLKKWCASEFTHPQAQSVLAYVSQGTVIKDLVAARVLHLDADNKLLNRWLNDNLPAPDIFGVLPKEGGELDQGSALVCWSVERKNDPNSDTWKDHSIQKSWIEYEAANGGEAGFCYISGEITPLATNHPAKLRHTGDKAKLISSNDSSGFTFRGKFLESTQVTGIGFEVTQKAHNALRWLISRQGVKNGDQVIVAWAISGKKIPNPVSDPFDFDDEDDLSVIDATPESQPNEKTSNLNLSSNLGQRVALKLKLKIKGYQQNLGETEQLSIMVIDSATPGRMGVTYYQECLSEEYFSNLNAWYENFSWYQRYSKEILQPTGKKPKSQVIWPISPPAPYVIAQAAYGKTLTDTLKKNIYARILPCIAEGCAFPIDVVNLCVARACNPNGGEHWEWERNVGVACALYRGYFSRHPKLELRRNFFMTLDITNQSRDYLYGRLLAVAEEIEHLALVVGGEKRSTTAERFMQQFADRPFSTWRNIELALRPYMERLRNNRAGFLNNRQKELTDIMNLFDAEKFLDDKKLTGEFLLGYHCQKMTYRKTKSEEANEPTDVESPTSNTTN